MAQYIDKAALVAEIENRLDKLWDSLPNTSDVVKDTFTREEANIIGKYIALESFRNYIDILEVKYIDVEKEKHKNGKENNIVIEDYVSLETAKLLKDKGFNEVCKYEYGVPDVDKGYVLQEFCQPIQNCELIATAYTAPTLQMAMKWLREVHDKNIILDMTSINEDCYVLWTYNVYCNKNYKIMWGHKQPKYNTYEEACEEAIKYCLENLI